LWATREVIDKSSPDGNDKQCIIKRSAMEQYGSKKSHQSQHHSLISNTTRQPKRYDVFLSHHGSDKEQVEIIAARLKDEAGLKPFLDKWNLEPGEPWQEEIETALNDSASCAVFVGPSGLAPWQNEKMGAALDQRIRDNSLRVIPVLLEHAEPVEEDALPEFLQPLVWVDLRSGLSSQEAFFHLVTGIQGKKYRVLTQAAFHRLLNWLNEENEDDDSGGRKYEEMRQKLISYFDRRNCRSPEDLADETLNRVALKLDEKGSITNVTPAQFCFIKARQVLHEYWRRPDLKEIALEDTLVTDLPDQHPSLVINSNDEQEEEEKRMRCLEHCLQNLKRSDHDLIIRYYYGEERVKIDNRQKLANELGISSKALVVRALRIRKKLEECVERCAGV
jgi:DNA-directed RNA polymerase specialized sigma24 family protein